MRYINLPFSRQFIIGVVLYLVCIVLAVYLAYYGTNRVNTSHAESMITAQSATIYDFMESKSHEDIISFIQVLDSNPVASTVPSNISYIEWISDDKGKGPVSRTPNNSTIKPHILENFKEQIRLLEENGNRGSSLTQYMCDHECYILEYSSYQINNLSGKAIVALKLQSISELLENLNNRPTIMLYGISEQDNLLWLDQNVTKLSWGNFIEPNKRNRILNTIAKYRYSLNGKTTYRQLLDAICEDQQFGNYVITPISFNHQLIGYTVTFLPKITLGHAFKTGVLENLTITGVLTILAVVILCHYIFNLIRLESFFIRNRLRINKYAKSKNARSSDEVFALLGHLDSALNSNEEQTRQIESLQNKLEFYSNYDPQTSLPNQKWILEQIAHLQTERKVNSAIELFAVEFCPVLPQEFYDDEKICHRISTVMLNIIREKDYLAFYEPTVYYLLTTSIKNKTEMDELLNRFRRELAEQVNGGNEIRISAGIVQVLSNSISPAVIMKQTHIAYQHSCQLEVNDSYAVYNDSMNTQTSSIDTAFANRLKHARMKGDLIIRYDQVMNVSTKTIVSLIARNYWFQEGTTYNLDDFTDQIISAGLNTENCYWKVENALHDLSELDQDTNHNIGIIIPLNYGQLLDSDLPSFLDMVTVKYRIMPNRITFALTENAISNDITNCLTAIQKLSSAGYHFTLQNYNMGMMDMDFIREHGFASAMLSGSLTKRVLTSEYDRYMLSQMVKKWNENIEPVIILQDVDSMITMETFKELGVNLMSGSLFPCTQDLSAVKAFVNREDSI